MKRKSVQYFSYIFYTALVIYAAIWVDSLFYCLTGDPHRATKITIQIPKGSSYQSVSQLLAAQGVIESPRKFVLLGRLLGKTSSLKWGEYELASPSHPIDVLKELDQGHHKTYLLTIPEGWNLTQIAALLEHQQLTENPLFLNYAKSLQAAMELGVPGPTLEGYLFPTTYNLTKGLTPFQLGKVMTDYYRQIFTPAYALRAQELGLSEREVITLASIVEKETGTAQERALIASVYYNRLHRKMRLQADPTVIYAIENFNGNLTKRHLQTYTPYNTYLIYGLPPGPIANPGAAAIQATLYPATSDYLFFVADNVGAHRFSKTYNEHAQYVRQFQPIRLPAKRPQAKAR